MVFIKVMLTRWKVFRCVHNAKNAAKLYKFFAGIDLAILRTVMYADN